MNEPIDLGQELAGYTGERPPRTRAEADVYLGDILKDLHIPKGPPPEPVLWFDGTYHPAGEPPPELMFDGDGVYFIHPDTGDRINIEPQCANCGARAGRLTQTNADPRWLCDKCKAP